MASISTTRIEKGHEKIYMVNKDSIDDMINLSLIDFQLKTFKPTSMLSDNPFFNIL